MDEWTIQSSGDGEQETIRQSRQTSVRDSELANEPCGCDAIANHDEGRSLLDFIGPECEDDGHDHREDVDGYGEQLGTGGRVAELLDHCWNGGGESTLWVRYSVLLGGL